MTTVALYMNPSHRNPYEPPTGTSGRSMKTTGSLTICIYSAVVTTAYFAFTVVLLRTPDRSIGLAFLGNTILMICLTVSVYRSTRLGVVFGIAAILVHTLIMLVLLFMMGAETWVVVMTWVVAVFPLYGATMWSWSLSRKN